MWSLLKLAFRNVFRFKRRTFITLAAISVGLALLVISISLLDGIDQQSISNIINCQTSHIKIFKKGYFDRKDKLPMDLTITGAEELQVLIGEIQDVRATENRIFFGASLIKGVDELPCLGVAIETEKDPDLFNIKESILEGEWLRPGEAKVLIGKGLAKDIGLKVGDLITVRMITSSEEDDFSWNAMDLEVKGIFESGNPTVDNMRIIVPLKTAQEGLSLGTDVTEIVVRLKSGDDRVIERVMVGIRERLKSKNLNLEVYSWKDLAGDFLMISQMKSKGTGMIVFILLFIASMGIINTMLMAVMERTREIGMMAALGMKKSEIMKLFIFEGGFIGVFGSLLGCLLGGLVSWYLEVEGWSMSFLARSPDMKRIMESVYPVKDLYYADLTFNTLLLTFLFGTAIAILASMYPARKAAKMNPIQALRHI
jgi:putative ABC transport system permease protein